MTNNTNNKNGNNDTRSEGRAGEAAACDYLICEGYRITERNYYAPHGEIDIIAEDDNYIVFVEVKLRSGVNERFGRPANAVDYKKKEHIRMAAADFLRRHPSNKQVRADIIEIVREPVDGDFIALKINHVKRAFGR